MKPTVPKEPMYTCRGGSREGYGVQVGRYVPGTTSCDFSYGGREVEEPDFEFLVMSWQSASGGTVPANAVVDGYDTPPPGEIYGPSLYPCRGSIAGSLQLGKIRPGFGGCVIPYSGRELTLTTYQVLVNETPAMPLATVSASNGFVPQDAIRAGTDGDGIRFSGWHRLERRNAARLPGFLQRGVVPGQDPEHVEDLQFRVGGRRSGRHLLRNPESLASARGARAARPYGAAFVVIFSVPTSAVQPCCSGAPAPRSRRCCPPCALHAGTPG
jgi:hypothetical protein